VAAVKGDVRMVELLAAAITDRQRVPEADIVVEVGGQRLRLDPAGERARDRARATGEPHTRPGRPSGARWWPPSPTRWWPR
jgi:hypothetical protein